VKILSAIFLLSVVLGYSGEVHSDPRRTPSLCSDLQGSDVLSDALRARMLPIPTDKLRRFAIVIGNDYHGVSGGPNAHHSMPPPVPPLENATNDAKSISALLATYNFHVVCFLNVTSDVNERILTISTTIGDAKINGLTLYYFAGHGFADSDQSYAVGAGATLESPRILESRSLSISDIISFLHSRDAPVVAIFDMCREWLPVPDQARTLKQRGYVALPSERGILFAIYN
jgi:uncharacterized caspase-like protein